MMRLISGGRISAWVSSILILAVITNGPADAGTFLVLNLNDSGPDSLRAAIDNANLAGPGPHVIDVQVSGIISLAAPLSPISSGITVSGAGTSSLTINGGGVIIDPGQDAALDASGTVAVENVSGDGSLTKQGGGTLTLNGTSSYNGGTTVIAGTLQGNTDTLQGSINNGSNVTFDQTAGGTYAGVMAGAGTLTKQGAGALTLSNANTFTGNTNVNVGRLVVNGSTLSSTSVAAGAELGGTGTVGSTTVSGTIAPGNSIGTMTVNGAYTQNAGSTYEVELDSLGTAPGVNNDLIDVIGAPGTATINGGTVDVTAAAGTYTAGTTYTILQSTGAVSGPGYVSVTDNLALRNFVLVYNANSIELVVERLGGGLFAGAALTENQFSVGTTLDAISPLATGDMGVVLDELLLLSPADQRSAMNQMSGELHGTMAALGLQQSSHIVQLLNRRLRNSVRRPALQITQAIRGETPAADESTVELASYTDSTRDPVIRRRSRSFSDGWVLGYGLGGDAQGDGNASGADYSLGGTLFGIERWTGIHTAIGMYGGYGQSHVRTAAPNQSSRVDSFQLGGYLRHAARNGYWLANGGFGYDDYESSRYVSFGGIDRVARADYSGQQAIAYLERGLSKQWKAFCVTPLAALQYIYLHQNNFSETGAGAVNLVVDDIDTHSLRGLLGIDLKRSFIKCGKPRLDTRIHALWMHEFLDTSGLLQARFSTANSPASDVRGLDLGRDWAVLGYGIEIQPRCNTKLVMNYDVQFNAHQTFHVGSGGVQLSW